MVLTLWVGFLHWKSDLDLCCPKDLPITATPLIWEQGFLDGSNAGIPFFCPCSAWRESAGLEQRTHELHCVTALSWVCAYELSGFCLPQVQTVGRYGQQYEQILMNSSVFRNKHTVLEVYQG